MRLLPPLPHRLRPRRVKGRRSGDHRPTYHRPPSGSIPLWIELSVSPHRTLSISTTHPPPTQVEHLKALLEERNALNAEGLRIQQAVQHQEEADSLRLMELLRAHEQNYAVSLEEAKADLERRIVLRMREEQELIQQEYEERQRALERAYTDELADARRTATAEARQALEADFDARLAKQQAVHEEAFLIESRVHAQNLDSLSTGVAALSAVLSHDSRYKHTSHAVHQLSALVLSIEESLSGRSALPAGTHAAALPKLAAQMDDSLLAELASALEGPLSRPVLSFPQLHARFERVAASGRVAALVPPGSGMWGQALASFVSSVTLPVSLSAVLPSDGAKDGASRVFVHAAEHLEQGSLAGAVKELRMLRGPPAAVCADWLAAAEQRLLVEQGLAAAKAETSVAMAALA